MTGLKRIIVFYFSSLLIFISIDKIFGGKTIDTLKSPDLWIVPILVILLSHFIGFVIVQVFAKPEQKQKFLNPSYLFCFIVTLGFMFFFRYSNWEHERAFGNIEANQNHFKYYGGEYVVQEKVAFESLSKLFSDPNSIKLIGGNTNVVDTVVYGNTITTFIITFHYKKKMKEPTFKAAFLVENYTAQLVYFDLPLNSADIHAIDSLEEVVIKMAHEGMKILPDSIRKLIKEDFDHVRDK